VAELLLHSPDVHTILQGVSRKGMSKCMRIRLFFNSRAADCALQSFSESRWIDVMPTYKIRSGILADSL